MARIHYHVVQHDGGWAYRLGDVYSEPFPRREDALAAAHRAAAAQHQLGETTEIQYEDEAGEWHTEVVRADDRPEADVVG